MNSKGKGMKRKMNKINNSNVKIVTSKLSNYPMKISFPFNMLRILPKNHKDQRRKSGVLMSHVILQYRLTILWKSNKQVSTYMVWVHL
jgi:hypothetical protein